ncbi:GNAT family N-acetyltransferase [Lentilitoribacter sp. EG35]|uniref:GNAT family N-acetyltransferase n=1 Tax=Lentilitoribacter sp. EG35 TaxID=3234192 RepID=UPI00346004BF
MQLESNRLLLRPLKQSDNEILFKLHTDPLVVELILNGKPMSRHESDKKLAYYLDEWDRVGHGFWIVYEKTANGKLEFVGRCGLRDYDGKDFELGYCFLGSSAGRGIASEAAKIVKNSAFDILSLKKIVAIVRPKNTASQAILKKLGFTYNRRVHLRGSHYLLYDLYNNRQNTSLYKEVNREKLSLL